MAVIPASVQRSDVAVAAVCILITYVVTLAVSRVYLSPLARFPGPRLAALSFWPEFYYDVVKRGRYTWKIAEMHKQYGEVDTTRPNSNVATKG